jgi:hypothetical protein
VRLRYPYNMSTEEVEWPKFPPYLHPLVLLPPMICLLFGMREEQFSDGVRFAGILIAVVILLATYVYQLRYLRKAYKRSIKAQLVLLAGAFLFPLLAVMAGNAAGGIHYGPEAASSIDIYVAIIIGLLCAAIAINLCAIGNTFTILQKGGGRAWRIAGVVMQTILWVLLAGIAFFLYSIAYSARDPNTE